MREVLQGLYPQAMGPRPLGTLHHHRRTNTTRTNDDDRYFSDAYQFMPADGYTAMFKQILDHPAIDVQLETSFQEVKARSEYGHVVFTGPIDALFDYRFGKLPYRSLRFDHEHIPGVARFQETGTINYPNDHDYTRITEFRRLTGQKHSGTSIVREYPPCGWRSVLSHSDKG